ncbi:hypothetical protein SAMN04490355_104722 [Pelosinus propionicus DSM 13327]|uniref:Uncharacterized protein n=1 Tax=Pelosinus propionicus DSM 13327 TaxID=1123291 RepID=A0A1I4NIZ4_9FIRM|nr:hypothetical protein SAMN04490355_104722 [Pelosinus propionicus DSM 13327]
MPALLVGAKVLFFPKIIVIARRWINEENRQFMYVASVCIINCS